MTLIPIALYWGIALWGLFSRRPVLLYLFFASFPFGALAVVPPALTAGLTFLPATMTTLLIVLRTVANERRFLVMLAAGLDLRRLGLLSLFILVAAVATLFLPRLFAGSVMVVPLRGSENGVAPLGPSVQNISQLAYISISVMGVFAFAQVLKTPASRQTALHALALAAALTIATGALDFASQFLPITPFLDIFRTATYTLLTDAEVGGAKRVVGFTTEASSFGSLCLVMLCMNYFLRRAVRNDRLRDIGMPLLCLGTFAFAWLSTSSATYVGLCVFLLAAALEWVFRFFEMRYSRLRRRYLGPEFFLAAFGLLALTLLALAKPALFDAFADTIDNVVLKKTGTSSFEERSMWSAVSLQAFFATYGLGVGLGGTRASNSIIVVFSNVGLLGALLYFGFIIQSLLRRAAWNDAEGKALVSGQRYAFVPPFVVGLLVGTTADFGATGTFRYGMLTAIGLAALGSTDAARRSRRAETLPSQLSDAPLPAGARA